MNIQKLLKISNSICLGTACLRSVNPLVYIISCERALIARSLYGALFFMFTGKFAHMPHASRAWKLSLVQNPDTHESSESRQPRLSLQS